MKKKRITPPSPALQLEALGAAGLLPAPPSVPDDAPSIVSRAPRPRRAKYLDKEGRTIPKQTAGKYRVIHGRIAIPLPLDAHVNPISGEPIAGRPVCEWAEVGDVVQLGELDATMLVHEGVIEPASVPLSESRAGECWVPPKGTRNLNAMIGGWSAGAHPHE